VTRAPASATDEPSACAHCGRLLLDDLEDDPVGESGPPLCGECNRNRNFAAVEELDLFDDDDAEDPEDADDTNDA